MSSKLIVTIVLIAVGIIAAIAYQKDEWSRLTSKANEESYVGHYDQAKIDYVAALKLVDKPDGDKTKLIASLRNLANNNSHGYQTADTEVLLRRALAIAESEPKEKIRSKPLILWELAWVLDRQQRRGECRKARQEALAIWLKGSGPYPTEAEICMNTVAKDYIQIGHFAEAEEIYKQSISNRKINRLCIHSGTNGDLADTSNMAELALSQKNYSLAAELFKKLSSESSLKFGSPLQSVHPDTLRAADMYCRAGDYESAGKLFQHALVAFKKNSTSEHKSEFSCLYSLALIYDMQGEFDKAKPLYEYCFTQEKNVDKKYPVYLPVEYSNMTTFLEDTKQDKKKEELLNHNTQLAESVLGRDHVLTTIFLGNKAWLYEEQGKFEQSQQMYERILFNNTKNFGLKSERVCNSLSILGRINLNHGNLTKAQSYLEQALELDKQEDLGPCDTVSTRKALASVYSKQGKPEKAALLLTDILKNELHILKVQEEEFGGNAPHLSIALENCAETYYLMGKYPQAAGLFTRTAALQESDPSISPDKLVDALTYKARLLGNMHYIAEAKELESKVKTLNQKLAARSKS